MKFFLISFIATVLLYSCNDKADTYKILIEGHWVKELPEGNLLQQLVFSFEDSLCQLKGPFSKKEKYWIESNLITIKRLEKTSYRILKITEDSLVLGNIIINGYPDTSMLHFSKIKTANNISPTKLFFYASSCYGNCSSFYMEADSTGNIIYCGLNRYTKKGGFSGQLSTNAYNNIVNLIRTIKLDSLQKKYVANWTDDQTCSLIISYGEKSYKTSVYGYHKEPIELRILINKLLEINEYASLKEDSTISELNLYQNSKLQDLYLPILPPPLSNFK